jgi:hypothetical protein
MSMIGTLSSPTNARYSPDDTPGSSAPLLRVIRDERAGVIAGERGVR